MVLPMHASDVTIEDDDERSSLQIQSAHSR